MPTMQSEALRSYIANLPVGTPFPSMAEDTAVVNPIDIDNLPNGIVTGSNLIQFPADASPELKSSVALSLAAKRTEHTCCGFSPRKWAFVSGKTKTPWSRSIVPSFART